MTVTVHTPTVTDLAKAAWANAIARRTNKPTMPKATHPNKAQKVIQAAYEDSLYLCALHLADLSISLRQVEQAGMGRARWEYARALLSMARLIDGPRITERSEETLRARLEGAFQRALAHPELFYARVPAGTRRRNHRKF